MTDDLKDLISQRIHNEVAERPPRDLTDVIRRGTRRRRLTRGATTLVVVVLAATVIPLTDRLAREPSEIGDAQPAARTESAPAPEEGSSGRKLTSKNVDPTPAPADGDGAKQEDVQTAYTITPRENGFIAYSLTADEGMELHVTRSDGSGDAVIPTPQGDPWHHAWSPDGSKIAVTMFPGFGGDHAGGDMDRSIWVMSADGSDATRVAHADNVSVASWSPDGGSIAYVADTGNTAIHIVNPDGSNDRIIYTNDGSGYIFSAQFSPDGTKILFDRGTDSRFDIFVMDADGSDVRQLTTTGTDYDPSWSPNGSRIVFTRQNFQRQSSSDIFVMDADGGNVTRLTDGGEGKTNLNPVWSPDGTKILYGAGVTGGPGGVVIMNADGSDPRILVEADAIGVSWRSLSEGEDHAGGSDDQPPAEDDEEAGLTGKLPNRLPRRSR